MTDHGGITESVTVWLALWGAVLSTILGALKAWEVWKGRFRIDVGCMLRGNPEFGNTITVRNLSGNPVIVEYWELLWVSGRWPRRTESVFNSPAEYATDIHVAPGASYPLRFAGPDYFDWGVRGLGRRSIYMRLHIAGRRRPVLRRIHT